DRVIDAVLLVSGDRDLEEAVRVAQGVGCKVVVAHPRSASVALALRQLADATVQLDRVDLTAMLVQAAGVSTAHANVALAARSTGTS
ncbi:MAG TPA: hypothetical protein VGO86_14105, partial [Candidatus Dormibacteraeota bacterium]